MSESMMAFLFGFYLFCVIYFLGSIFWGDKDVFKLQLDQIQSMGGKQQEDMKNRKRSGKQNEKKGSRLSEIDLPGNLQNDLDGAGIPLRAVEFLGIWLVSASIFPFASYFVMRNLLLSAGMLLVGVLIPPTVVRILWKRRRMQFGTQLGDSLMAVSSCLRSGFSIHQAIERISTDMPDPIGQEFRNAVSEMNYGSTLEEALNAMAKRMMNKDLRLVTTAVNIQQQVGGNLSEIIDHVAETIKERIRIRRMLQTLTAQGKMSGLLLSGLPVFMLIALTFMNPEYVGILYTTSYGHMLLAASVVMEMIGYFLISRIVDIKID